MKLHKRWTLLVAMSLVAFCCPVKEVDPDRLDMVGWKEEARLPELGIESIWVKVDSGAKTSSLHAEEIQEIRKGEERWVRFRIYPKQDSQESVFVEAPLSSYKEVKDSGAKVTLRPVIITPISIGQRTWDIEITLVGRDAMGFRMLLGRQALRNSFIIHPGESFLQSK